MSERETSASAWLVRVSGVESGRRAPLGDKVTLVGRDRDAGVVVRGEDADLVSGRHVELHREPDGGFRIVDLGSTNGLYLNGSKIDTARLAEGAIIELGRGGPRFRFTLHSAKADSAFRHDADAGAKIGATAARLRRAAVEAVRHPGRRTRRVLAGIAAAAIVFAAVAFWQVRQLRQRHTELTLGIIDVEAAIEADSSDRETLIAEVDELRREIAELEGRFWFGFIGSVRPRSFVELEIERLLEEFGAERYSVPAEFVRNVESHIERFRTADRKVMERAFTVAAPRFKAMREQFEAENLPADLAYLVLVESSLLNSRSSSAGAVGLWQLRAPTARQYGLRVDDQVDERLDPVKSTAAASRYLKRLILEFGSGSSVMLALAAYNLGPTRVRAAVRRVEDPIQQRNFWYLYRARRLPKETREYVPRILAAIIIGRNPERYGFP